MKITINDEIRELPDCISVTELLNLLELQGKFVAVERNKQIISFRHFQDTFLQEGDVLEIVTLVGGG